MCLPGWSFGERTFFAVGQSPKLLSLSLASSFFADWQQKGSKKPKARHPVCLCSPVAGAGGARGLCSQDRLLGAVPPLPGPQPVSSHNSTCGEAVSRLAVRLTALDTDSLGRLNHVAHTWLTEVLSFVVQPHHLI